MENLAALEVRVDRVLQVHLRVQVGTVETVGEVIQVITAELADRVVRAELEQ